MQNQKMKTKESYEEPCMMEQEEKAIANGKQKALAILDEVYAQMSMLSDDELFDMMMQNSPTFRKRVEELENGLTK